MDSWVPADACTLPTRERPMRVAEFDDLFAKGAVAVRRVSRTELRVALRAEPPIAAQAAELAMRESGCCAFFRFDVVIVDGELEVRVGSDEQHAEVLAAFADRVDELSGVGR